MSTVVCVNKGKISKLYKLIFIQLAVIISLIGYIVFIKGTDIYIEHDLNKTITEIKAQYKRELSANNIITNRLIDNNIKLLNLLSTYHTKIWNLEEKLTALDLELSNEKDAPKFVVPDNWAPKERLLAINEVQLRELIRSTLKNIDMYSDNMEELLILTAATESKLGHYLKQIKGPAQGIFQMEPSTEKGVLGILKKKNPKLYDKLIAIRGDAKTPLISNLEYQICIAAINYNIAVKDIPDKTDFNKLYTVYKKYWNTYAGAATKKDVVINYMQTVKDLPNNI